MAKLSINPAPTFKADVPVSLAGKDNAVVDVEMTFRHRTKSELVALQERSLKQSDLETFNEMVTGWNLEDAPFDPEHVAAFLENYAGAALATWETYKAELTKVKRKN